MARRDILESSERGTQYFAEIARAGQEPGEDETEARTFAGQMNILLKRKGLLLKQAAGRCGESYENLRRYMGRPMLGSGERNPNYRSPSAQMVFRLALAMALTPEELDRLLDAADLAPLKPWRRHRGDDLIALHHAAVAHAFENEPNAEYEALPQALALNRALAERGLEPLFKGAQYGTDA